LKYVNYLITYLLIFYLIPSVLCRFWLGGRKDIRPVKNRVVGCWCGCLSGALRCRLAYGPADATALTVSVSCFSKIQIGFTFLVPARPGSPGKWAVKRVSVCVCYFLSTGGRKEGRKKGRNGTFTWRRHGLPHFYNFASIRSSADVSHDDATTFTRVS